MAQLVMVAPDCGFNLDHVVDWTLDRTYGATSAPIPRLIVRLAVCGEDGSDELIYFREQATMLAAYLASRSIDVVTWYAHFRESAAWDEMTPLQRAVALSM